jgi:acetyl esterase
MEKSKLDPEITAFLEKCASVYPDNAVSLDIEENRRCYARLCNLFQAAIPAGMSKTDGQISGRNGVIPIRTYIPADANPKVTVNYLHGGGFILGGLQSHDSICAEIADRTSMRLVSVDYRLAPEHTFPVQVEDAVDAFLGLDTGSTVMAGDSAGASLAAAVCISQRQSPHRPVGQVLVYPALGGRHLGLDSYQSQHDAPALTTADVDAYGELWSAGDPPWSDPLFAPLVQRDMSGIAPCVAFAAEYDPLRDDAAAYVEKLVSAGIKSECYVEPGLVHGYLRARYCSEKAAASFGRICSAITRLANL